MRNPAIQLLMCTTEMAPGALQKTKLMQNLNHYWPKCERSRLHQIAPSASPSPSLSHPPTLSCSFWLIAEWSSLQSLWDAESRKRIRTCMNERGRPDLLADKKTQSRFLILRGFFLQTCNSFLKFKGKFPLKKNEEIMLCIWMNNKDIFDYLRTEHSPVSSSVTYKI